jgi:hypothetical protein
MKIATFTTVATVSDAISADDHGGDYFHSPVVNMTAVVIAHQDASDNVSLTTNQNSNIRMVDNTIPFPLNGVQPP